MMKKTLQIFAVFLLAGVLTSCGNDNNTPAVSQTPAEPFSYQEMADIFEMKKSDVLMMFGDPDRVEEVPYFEMGTCQVYTYGENVFSFVYYEEPDDAYLFSAVLADERISAPRDLKIGDSLETVLSKFQDNGDTALHALEGYNNGETAEYRLLYGEYTYMESYGIVIYQEDQAVEVEYAEKGAVLRLHFAEEKLIAIEYVIPLS